MKYLKLFESYLINEYLKSSDNLALYKYFNMTEEEKKESLPYDFSWLFEEFLEEEEIEFNWPTHDYLDVDGEQRGHKLEDFELPDWLLNHNKQLLNKFADWIYDKISNVKHNKLGISDRDLPAWTYFDKPEIIKEQWLIHQTDDADSIERYGFTHGMEEIEKLGLTTEFSKESKKYGGYNFAYTIYDFKRYGYSRYRNQKFKYGKELVIFRCSGVRVWHHTDNEPQVVFWGKLATHINIIEEGETANWGIYNNKTRRLLYQNDDIEKVIDWFVENYNQYKNYLN